MSCCNPCCKPKCCVQIIDTSPFIPVPEPKPELPPVEPPPPPPPPPVEPPPVEPPPVVEPTIFYFEYVPYEGNDGLTNVYSQPMLVPDTTYPGYKIFDPHLEVIRHFHTMSEEKFAERMAMSVAQPNERIPIADEFPYIFLLNGKIDTSSVKLGDSSFGPTLWLYYRVWTNKCETPYDQQSYHSDQEPTLERLKELKAFVEVGYYQDEALVWDGDQSFDSPPHYFSTDTMELYNQYYPFPKP